MGYSYIMKKSKERYIKGLALKKKKQKLTELLEFEDLEDKYCIKCILKYDIGFQFSLLNLFLKHFLVLSFWGRKEFVCRTLKMCRILTFLHERRKQ